MPNYVIKDSNGEPIEVREAPNKFAALTRFAAPRGGHVSFSSYIPITVGLDGSPHKAERVDPSKEVT